MTGFVSVLRLADLPVTGYVEAAVAGHSALVARFPDGVFAVENRCSHAASELSGGRLKMGRLSCPLHGAQFDFRTGASMGGTRPPRGLRTFAVCVTGDDAFAASQPSGRLAQPDDIVDAIMFLASDRAGFVNGSEMVVDNGFTAQ